MTLRFSRILTMSASTLVLFPLITRQAFADGTGMMSYYGGGMGWGHMFFGSLMMLLLFGGLALVVVLVVRWIGSDTVNKTTPGNGISALDILNERFARGEIEKDDYEERKRILSE